MKRHPCTTPGYANGELSFAAGWVPHRAEIREIKICENCGMNFLRSLMSGVKHCGICVTELLAQTEVKALPLPPWDGPEEKALWRRRGPNKSKTAVDPRETSIAYRHAASTL